MLQTMHGGAQLDFVTPAEMKTFQEQQSAIQDVRERERLRGKKDMRRSTLLTTPAGTRPSVLDGITPLPGYKWVVRFVSVYLSATGTGQVFITSDSTSTLGALTQSKCIASFTTTAVYQTQSIPEGACILSADEGLYFNFTSNIAGYMLAGWESIAERIGEFA